jgi:AraC-like DNA-binding protein
VFSQIKGTTLEHYVIANKVEHVKELLAFGDLSLTEIAYRMQYSSVAHLSSQFKKVAGCTPTNFKQARNKQLIALEDL